MDKHVEAIMRLTELSEQKSNALIQLSVMLSAIAERMGTWASEIQDEDLKEEVLKYRTQILVVLQPRQTNKEEQNAAAT